MKVIKVELTMLKNKILLSFFTCFFFNNTTFPQTVCWKERPKWDSVEMLGSKLLRVEQSGKWGVIRLDGSKIVPCEYAEITNMREGKCLVLNDNGRIVSLLDDEGNSFPIDRIWFVDRHFPYYSNNRLAVYDPQGHWGFLDQSGKVVIEPNNGFLRAYPFFYELAAVQYSDLSWGFIYSNGNPLTYEKSKFRDGYKRINFVSSYTKIEGIPVALIRLNETMYMIDQYGNSSSQFFPKKGLPLNIKTLTPDVPISSDDVSFIFNEYWEIKSIVNDNKEYLGTTCVGLQEFDFPTIDNVTIDSDRRIVVGEMKICPQFQEIVPLPSNIILVKKEGKWGLITFDLEQKMSTISFEKVSFNRSNQSSKRNIECTLSNTTEKTKAYIIDESDNKNVIDVVDGRFSVPANYINKDNIIRVGLVIDSIYLEPSNLPISTSSLQKPDNNLSKKERIKVKLINAERFASFEISSNRSDWDKCWIIINNGNKQHAKMNGTRYVSGELNFNGQNKLNIPIKILDGSGHIIYNKSFLVEKKQ